MLKAQADVHVQFFFFPFMAKLKRIHIYVMRRYILFVFNANRKAILATLDENFEVYLISAYAKLCRHYTT